MTGHIDIGGLLYKLATYWSGGFLPLPVAAVIPILLIGLPLLYLRRGLIKSLAIAVFPLFWLSPMWWYLAFPHLPRYAAEYAPWQINVPIDIGVAYLVYGAVCIGLNHGLRKVTTIFWLINLPLVFAESFLATLAITHFS